MKKGTFIGLVALALSAIGVLIALAAYFKNKTSYLYDEDDFLFDNPEDLDYYMFDNEDLYNYDDEADAFSEDQE